MSERDEHDDYLEHVDFNKAGLLLHIVEKCAGHSGKLGALSNAAMTGLMRINEGAHSAARDQKIRRDEQEAERAAEAQRQAENEAQAQHPGPEPDGEPTIFTSDNPNPNLIDRRV